MKGVDFVCAGSASGLCEAECVCDTRHCLIGGAPLGEERGFGRLSLVHQDLGARAA
jgi:hypothetical protein